MSFDSNVAWTHAFHAQSKKQYDLGWNASRLIVPDWMLYDEVCSAEAADADFKRQMLAKAQAEIRLKSSDRGSQVSQKLSNGEQVQTWERLEDCGSSPGVKTVEVPLWHMEFHIPSVTSAEVFNLVVAKAQESSWNQQVAQAATLEQKSGARGIHEKINLPQGLRKLLYPREFWEWQIANYSAENRSYLVALSSQGTHSAPKFENGDVEAAQCLAAYEISPAGDSGVHFHMVTHTNPNGNFLLQKIGFELWETQGRGMLIKFANELTAAAQKLAQDVTQGHPLTLDDGVLALLNPTLPSANSTVSLENVASASGHKFYQQFGALDVPGALNSSSCPPNKFQQCAKAVHEIGLLLKDNTTEREWSALEKQASNALELQLQGVTLAAVQWRVVQELAREKCAEGPTVPDINDNGSDSGISMTLLIGAGVAIVLVIIACIISFCCCCRKRCRCCSKREVHLADDELILDPNSPSRNTSLVRINLEEA
jgi:hypothetical protein